MLSLPLGIAANAITARVLGPSEYGSLAFLLAFVTIALPLTELGIGHALVQWGVASRARGDDEETRRLLRHRTGFGLLVQAPLLWCAGLWLLRNDPHRWVVAAFVISSFVLVLGASAQAALLIEQRTATLAKIAMLVGVAVNVGVVLTAVSTADANSVWGVRLIMSTIAPVMALLLIGSSLRRATLRPHLSMTTPPGYWRFSILAWVAGASATLVYSRSEVFVLRLYSQASELGFFALAFGLSQQLTAPLDMLLGPLFPANAGLVASHASYARAALLRSLRFFGFLSGGLMTLAPAVFYSIPFIFGDDFSRSARLFIPLAIGSTLQTLSSPFTILAYARRSGSLLARTALIGLSVDVIAAFVLVYRFGAWGAVAANLLAQSTAIVLIVRGELKGDSGGVREAAAAARSWALGFLALGLGFLAGLAVERVSVVGAILAAGAAGPLSYAALVRGSGGVLTEADAGALLGAVPSSLRCVVRPALWVAAVRTP